MSRNVSSPSDFGKRLAAFRAAAGLTQEQLAKEIGISRRNLAYYEAETAYPPAHIMPDLAQALGVSADALLGISAEKPHGNARLVQRLKKLTLLPQDDQRTILKMIDTMLTANGIKFKMAA